MDLITRYSKMAYRERNRYSHFKKRGRADLWYPYWNFGSNIDPGSTEPSRFESMNDYTSPKPWPDHAWVHNKYSVDSLIRLNGESPIDWGNYAVMRYTDYCPLNWSSASPAYMPQPQLTPPSGAWLMTKFLANVNPNQPVVDVPLFIFEFKDFPRMLKGLGDVLARNIQPDSIAHGYLAYHFGWAPLFRDLRNLFDLSKSIEQRRKYIASIRKGARLNRKLFSAKQSTSGLPQVTFYNANSITATAKWEGDEEINCWASARLNAGANFPTADQDKLLSIKAALGSNLSAATIWNAIPWSWLMDYFSNVGDILAANRGGIPYTVSNLNIMTEVKVRWWLSGHVGYGTVKFSGGRKTTVLQGRAVPTIIAPLWAPRPWLNLWQIGALAALVTAPLLKGPRIRRQ